MYKVGPPLSVGNMFQKPQWLAEAMGSSQPSIYYIFPMHTYLR